MKEILQNTSFTSYAVRLQAYRTSSYEEILELSVKAQDSRLKQSFLHIVGPL